ncbi:MAG: exopolysaccharide biosynthesis protein [Hyphomonadaceae bacterium]
MDAGALAKSTKHQPESASALLNDLHDAFPNEKVTVGELIERLNGRAIGLLLLILALPMCIPNVPGISTIFGLLIAAPGAQMALGGRRLWLPRRVKSWSFPREGLQRAIRAAGPYLQRIERFIRPRWSILTRPPFLALFGLQTLLMAFVLVLPIPLGNWPPAVTVAITALALLQRDGLLMLLSIPAAGVSIVIAYAGVRIGWAALVELGQLIHSWTLALAHAFGG